MIDLGRFAYVCKPKRTFAGILYPHIAHFSVRGGGLRTAQAELRPVSALDWLCGCQRFGAGKYDGSRSRTDDIRLALNLDLDG